MFNAKTICRLTKKFKIKKLQNAIKETAILSEDRMEILLNSPINGIDIDDKRAFISWR